MLIVGVYVVYSANPDFDGGELQISPVRGYDGQSTIPFRGNWSAPNRDIPYSISGTYTDFDNGIQLSDVEPSLPTLADLGSNIFITGTAFAHIAGGTANYMGGFTGTIYRVQYVPLADAASGTFGTATVVQPVQSPNIVATSMEVRS